MNEENILNKAKTTLQADRDGQSIGAPVNKEMLVAEAPVVRPEGDTSPDFRYVRHGEGPCSCCGPYSE